MELEVNSMAVPRKAKQAVGGIAKLTRNDGSQMTVRGIYRSLRTGGIWNSLREGDGTCKRADGLDGLGWCAVR